MNKMDGKKKPLGNFFKLNCDRLWGGRKFDLFGSGFKKLNPAGKTDVIKATNL